MLNKISVEFRVELEGTSREQWVLSPRSWSPSSLSKLFKTSRQMIHKLMNRKKDPLPFERFQHANAPDDDPGELSIFELELSEWVDRNTKYKPFFDKFMNPIYQERHEIYRKYI